MTSTGTDYVKGVYKYHREEGIQAVYNMSVEALKESTHVVRVGVIKGSGMVTDAAETSFSHVKKIFREGANVVKRVSQGVYEEFTFSADYLFGEIKQMDVGEIMSGVVDALLFPQKEITYYPSGAGGASGDWELYPLPDEHQEFNIDNPKPITGHSSEDYPSYELDVFIRELTTGTVKVTIPMEALWLHVYEGSSPDLSCFTDYENWLYYSGATGGLTYGGLNCFGHPVYGGSIEIENLYIPGGSLLRYYLEGMKDRILRIKPPVPPFPEPLPTIKVDEIPTGDPIPMLLGTWQPRMSRNRELPFLFEALTARGEPLEAEGEPLEARKN